MSEDSKKALNVLDSLHAENRITDEEYKILFGAIERGPLIVGDQEHYTVFFIDGGAFVDWDDPSVGCVRMDEVDWRELGTLLRIAMWNEFDVVVRACD